MATYTPEEFDMVVDRFAKGLPTAINRATLAGMQQLEAQIPGRIHNTGGTKDVKGNTRKYRSKSYIKKRDAEGLTQLTTVDHTFNGDLKRSYKKVVSKKQIDLRIFGDLNVKKARGNERWYDNGVWEASETEEKRARKAFNKEISNYIKRFFSG